MKKIIGLLLSASMVISSVIPAFAAVSVDKTEEYNFGDSITITRDATQAAALEITTEGGKKVLWDSFKTGEKTKTFKIPAENNNLGWTAGTYTVKTGADTTTFEIVAAPVYAGSFVSWSPSTLTLAYGGSDGVAATFSDQPAGSTITYVSNNTSVATVTGNVVYGVGVGTTTIQAVLKSADGVTLATSTTDLAVTVINDNLYVGGGSATGSGSGTLGGGISGTTTSAGIFSRPDSYSANFSDLGAAAWSADAITFLAKKGIVSGYSETEFNPNGSITRAEFCKLIATLYNLVTDSAMFTNASFTDVSKDDWYFNYVEVCANLGIVTGYEDGTFRPNNLISRQEMAVIIYRVANIMGTTLTPVEAEKTFADAYLIADYAKTAVTALQRAGIISGTSDTTFEPTAGSTRAQAATIIYNMYTKYAK